MRIYKYTDIRIFRTLGRFKQHSKTKLTAFTLKINVLDLVNNKYVGPRLQIALDMFKQ